MSDLSQRLRDKTKFYRWDWELKMECAARIEKLEAQRDELLAALELVVSFVDAGEGTWTLEEQQKARAAIAKAKGEE